MARYNFFRIGQRNGYFVCRTRISARISSVTRSIFIGRNHLPNKCWLGTWNILMFNAVAPLISAIFETTEKKEVKCKVVPRQAEVALGVPGRLRPRIFSTFGTTRVVGLQPNVPAAFTPGEIPGTHFQRMSGPQGTWFCRKEPRKKSPVTPPGIDPGSVRLVAQRLNHYATPGPN